MRASIIFAAALFAANAADAGATAWRWSETGDAAVHLTGNQSSNSSSNSSDGIHTRVDTYQTDDGRGRRTYERRIYQRYEYAPPRGRRRGGWRHD
jgi:hypothetical protein